MHSFGSEVNGESLSRWVLPVRNEDFHMSAGPCILLS